MHLGPSFIIRDNESDSAKHVRAILAAVRSLAAEYYRITRKPLGVTGEVAEYVAAELLELTLAPPRTAGYDATRSVDGKEVRIQVKGRAFGGKRTPGQRLGRIKTDAQCDTVLLVLLDNATLDPIEILEADYGRVCERLNRPGSKARERGALAVSEFRRIAVRVWPRSEPSN